ncbi:MAG: hypothetical protein LBH95_08595 [Oscillospiraceae bacterium]|jgi:hypothetical protein|nr:hypothetical protein [Oscillospiraceae bacterium]
MKKMIILISTIIALLIIAYFPVSYTLLTNEMNKAPVISDIPADQKESIINNLRMNVDISSETEMISLQLFSDTRNPSALIVIKTNNDYFDNLKFYSADEFWTYDEKENVSKPAASYPFIIKYGKKIWPVEATETDPRTLIRLYKYPSFDDYTWICISTSKNIDSYFDVIKKSIAERSIFYLVWR